jgi:parvulin-like peptidyl-prolyl isomerase
MISRIRIQVWDEAVELTEAFNRLKQVGMEERVIQAFTEQLVMERSMREYQLFDKISHHAADDLLNRHRQNLDDEQRQQLDDVLKNSPDAHEQLINRLLAEERLNALKRHVIPLPLVQEAFMNYKSKQETVVFQMLRLSSRALAREIYFRVQHDHHDFDSLIRQHATGSEAEHGGLVGPVPVGRIKPEIRRQIESLLPGAYSLPFASEPKRWSIVRLLRRDNLTMTPDIETQIRDGLFNTWLQQQRESARAMPACLTQAESALMNQEICQR